LVWLKKLSSAQTSLTNSCHHKAPFDQVDIKYYSRKAEGKEEGTEKGGENKNSNIEKIKRCIAPSGLCLRWMRLWSKIMSQQSVFHDFISAPFMQLSIKRVF